MRVVFFLVFLICYVHTYAKSISLDKESPFLIKKVTLFDVFHQRIATDTFPLDDTSLKETLKVTNVISYQEAKTQLAWLNKSDMTGLNIADQYLTNTNELKIMEQAAQKAKFKLHLSLFCMLVLVILTTFIGYFTILT